jgi:hypothetical protein
MTGSTHAHTRPSARRPELEPPPRSRWRPPRRRTRRRIAAGVLLLASVAAGVAIVLALDDDSPERAPQAGAGPREEPVASIVGSPIPIGATTAGIGSGPRSVWVVTSPEGTVLRLDQALNRMSAAGGRIGGRPSAHLDRLRIDLGGERRPGDRVPLQPERRPGHVTHRRGRQPLLAEVERGRCLGREPRRRYARADRSRTPDQGGRGANRGRSRPRVDLGHQLRRRHGLARESALAAGRRDHQGRRPSHRPDDLQWFGLGGQTWRTTTSSASPRHRTASYRRSRSATPRAIPTSPGRSGCRTPATARSPGWIRKPGA